MAVELDPASMPQQGDYCVIVDGPNTGKHVICHGYRLVWREATQQSEQVGRFSRCGMNDAVMSNPEGRVRRTPVVFRDVIPFATMW